MPWQNLLIGLCVVCVFAFGYVLIGRLGSFFTHGGFHRHTSRHQPR